MNQDLLVADLLSRETREWNVAKINRTLPELAERILQIRPSRLGTHDTYIWNLKSSGEYTTKTGYMALTQNIAEVSSPATTNSIDWRKSVWSNRTAPKIKLFLWKSLHEALPTGFNLQKRGMREHTACCRCGAIETTDHLLFQCRFARDLWSLGPWEIPFDSSSCDFLSVNLLASLHWRNLPPIGISINIFPWICWIIWVERNRLLFERRISTPEEALVKAIKAAREWEAAQLTPQKALKLNLRSTPEKELPPNTITCNTDAAWIASSTKAGLGWIFFDSSAMEINRGSSNQLHVSSACMAEALAVREALLHASSLGFTKIWLRSDSQVLMRAINQKRGPTELFGVLSDIVSLSSSFQFCCFSFLPRDLNGLADSIAKAQLCA